MPLYSNTNFTMFDYNPEVLRLADEIDPGQFNVCNSYTLVFYALGGH